MHAPTCEQSKVRPAYGIALPPFKDLMISKKKIVRRCSDGNLFSPSFPPGWTDYDALCSMMRGPEWYFVSIEKIPPRWYWPFTTYKKTGEIWETEDHRAFDMAYS